MGVVMTFTEFISMYSGRFIDGTLVTLMQTALATVLTVFLAFSFGLMKLSPNRLVRGFAICYIELFRGTSLLVQLFWVFYVLPLFGLTLDAFTAGFVTVGLNLGSYGAELVRGGIQAVPRGQWEAAKALNMPNHRRMIRIILPQALLTMLPAWGNLLIELLKGTALVALISVSDLMFEAKQINGTTFLSAQAFGTALIIYYILARFIITPGMRLLESYMTKKMGME